MTLFLTVSWLLWTCLFFGLARAVQESAMEHGVVPATWGDIRGESVDPCSCGWPACLKSQRTTGGCTRSTAVCLQTTGAPLSALT